MVTTTWMMGLNSETQSVMNYMSGQRTSKQIVWEFFWLREEAVYDDEWVNVIDFINDFKDEAILKKKWVHYHPRFKEIGVTEEAFTKLFYWVKPEYARITKQSDNWSDKKPEVKQWLSSDNWGDEKGTKDTWAKSVWWNNDKWVKKRASVKKKSNK